METPREFEWDDAKNEGNFVKHGIRFEYVVRVFLDPALVDFDATHPEDGEERRKAVGKIEGKLFVVVYTLRGVVYRIVSGRRANAMETRRYG